MGKIRQKTFYFTLSFFKTVFVLIFTRDQKKKSYAAILSQRIFPELDVA